MSMRFFIIGLSGPAGCGKDTVARILRTHVGFSTLAFADALREEVCHAYGIEPLYFIRRETKEVPMQALALRQCRDQGFVGRMALVAMSRAELLDLDAPRSPRQIMQWWGTEYRRAQDTDYWLSMLERRMQAMLQTGDQCRLVVTDCRFANEVERIRSDMYGGVLWQVTRPGCRVRDSEHVSEVTGERFEPERVIDNSADIRHLQQQVLGAWWALETGLQDVTVEITP